MPKERETPMFVNALLSQHSSTPSTAWGKEGGKALVAQLLCCLYVVVCVLPFTLLMKST